MGGNNIILVNYLEFKIVKLVSKQLMSTQCMPRVMVRAKILDVE